MTQVARRRRGTAIVETTEGILIAAGSHGAFLLPGGKARDDESRIKAAERELHEETGLTADSTKFLFYHVGESNRRYHYRDHHKVCLIVASGRAIPHHEIKRIAYYRPGYEIRVTADTKAIIERYYALTHGKTTIGIMSPKPSLSGLNDPNISSDNSKVYLNE